jgi:putative salt-induced outer membrane protein YdiY
MSMSRWVLILLSSLSMGSDRAWAQAQAAPRLWSGELSAGASLSEGNTEEADANLGALAQRATSDNDVKLKATADWKSSNSETTAQRYYALGRYAYNLGRDKRWFNSYNLEWDRDRFANIDWRVTPTVGIGYWFSNTQDFKLSSEAGIGWERTQFRDGTASRSDAVVVGKLNLDKKISESARLTQDLSVWPSLGDVGEFRLRSETALTTTITQSVALRLALLEEYLSNPAGDKEENDVRLTASAVYTF